MLDRFSARRNITLEMKMNHVRTLATAMLIFILCSCTNVYTVHPLLSDEDLTQDVDLSGEWECVDKDLGPILRLKIHGKNAKYSVKTINNIGESKSFELKVGKMNNKRYLECSLPADSPDAEKGTRHGGRYFCIKFTMKEDSLVIYRIDGTEFNKALRKTPMAHLKWGEYRYSTGFLLKEKPEAVRKFLETHEAKIWLEKSLELRRINPAADK